MRAVIAEAVSLVARASPWSLRAAWRNARVVEFITERLGFSSFAPEDPYMGGALGAALHGI